jgi:hypothetical protein
MTTKRDDLATTLAIGTLCSIAQFVVHEVLGHGSACLLLGGRILAVAPLWMQCSVPDRTMVLAGPAANVVAGALCWTILRWRPPAAASLRLFLWLSIAFQWLVAAGYLAVGAASGFGDWPVILPELLGSSIGRVVAVAAAAGAYFGVLRTLAHLGVERFGPSLREEARLRRLTFLPSLAAGTVAVAAELVGHRYQPLGLALALGCTAFVGWSLLGLPRLVRGAPTHPGGDLPVHRGTGWILAAAVVAVVFLALSGLHA